MSFSHKHILALLQTGFTTIRVVYDKPSGTVDAEYNVQPWDGDGNRPGSRRNNQGLGSLNGPEKAYTYKAKVTDKIQVNDRVILDAPSGLTIGTVVEVHPEPKIDLNADFTYKWIVGKVDLAGYRELLDKEDKFMQLVTEAERARQRENLIEQFKTTLPASGEARSLFDQALELFGNPAVLSNDKPAE